MTWESCTVDNPGQRLALAVALVLLGDSAIAANRCVDAKGKVTYQDAACSNAESNAKVDTSEAFSTRPALGAKARAVAEPVPQTPTSVPGGSSDYATFRGAWRGPMQFELSLNGARDGGAHAIAPSVIEIRPDGEVMGQASASGCVLSGLATQNIAPYIGSLDVSLKGCKDPRFNTRYNGNLSAIASAKEARLHLVGLVMKAAAPLTVQMQQVSLDAVLKR
jgi:hypothetical protein